MSLLSSLLPVGIILFIFVLLANTGWLGMTLLGLALDTSRETRHESAVGTKLKIALSAGAEVIMVIVASVMVSYYWSTLGG